MSQCHVSPSFSSELLLLLCFSDINGKIMSHGTKRSTRALVPKFSSRHGLKATLDVFYSKYFKNLVFNSFKDKKVLRISKSVAHTSRVAFKFNPCRELNFATSARVLLFFVSELETLVELFS